MPGERNDFSSGRLDLLDKMTYGIHGRTDRYITINDLLGYVVVELCAFQNRPRAVFDAV